MTELKPAWWLSWYATDTTGPFTLHSPWWISGQRLYDGARTIVAAVRARTKDEARRLIVEAHDHPPNYIEWRFCTRLDRMSPFSGRFPRAAWMEWEEA